MNNFRSAPTVLLMIMYVSAAALGQKNMSAPSCDAVARDVQKYIGKTVSFVGMFSRSTSVSGPDGKLKEDLQFWRCIEAKDKEDVYFAFNYSLAVWSDAAKKLKGPPVRVVGVVDGTAKMMETTVPRLKNVRIEVP